jgi:hypothetical protein
MRKQTQNPGQSLKPTRSKNVHVIKGIALDKPIWDPIALQKAVAIEIKQRAERALMAAGKAELDKRSKQDRDMTLACNAIENTYRKLVTVYGIEPAIAVNALEHVLSVVHVEA